MPGRDSLTGQSLQLAIGQGVGKALNFLGFVLIARALGPTQYGGFTFAFSLASLLAFIPNMGVDPYFSREVPARRSPPRDLVGTILTLKVCGGAAFLLVYLGIIRLSATGAAAQAGAVFIALSMILLAGAQTWRTVLITSRRAGLAGLFDAVQAGLFLSACATVVLRTPTVATAAMAFFLSQVVGVALGALVVVRQVGVPSLFRGAAAAGRVFRATLPLMMIWFLSDLYLRIDTTMLYYLRGDGDTGLYGASYRLVEGVYSAAIVVCAVSLPRMSGALAVGADRWREEWAQARRFLLLLVAPLGVILCVFAGPVIALLYGPSFAAAAKSLRILGPATVFLCLGYVYAAALTSIGLVWMQFWITLVALASNVILNAFWIPRFAGTGAAAATLCSALVFIALAHNGIRRGLVGPRPSLADEIPPLPQP